MSKSSRLIPVCLLLSVYLGAIIIFGVNKQSVLTDSKDAKSDTTKILGDVEKDSKTPSENETSEAKPPETQPPETKPPETQPPETKPPEVKPPEVKPPETKAPETKVPEEKKKLPHNPVILSLQSQGTLLSLTEKFRGVAVKFFSQQCANCLPFHPIYSQLGNEFANNEDVRICEVDCSYHRDICAINGAYSYPAVHLYINGKVDEYEGVRTVEGMKKFIEDHLNGPPPTLKIGQIPPVVSFRSMKELEDAQKFYRGVFVKFFDPFCTHCIRMAPAYERLGAEFVGTDVRVAEINCPQHYELCGAQGIRSFPTMFLYLGGRLLEYRGNRETDDMKNFLDGHMKLTAPKDVFVTPITVIHTQPAFEEATRNSEAILVNFYSPEDPNSIQFTETYIRLAEAYAGNSKIKIAELDCTENNLCRANGVLSFPTVKFYSKGVAGIYSGDRSLDDLKEFVEARIKK